MCSWTSCELPFPLILVLRRMNAWKEKRRSSCMMQATDHRSAGQFYVADRTALKTGQQSCTVDGQQPRGGRNAYL